MVAEAFSGRFSIQFIEEGSDRDVLLRARDLVHVGHRILTAPLAGSIKPWETPYRSVMLTAEPKGPMDLFSLDLMERALAILRETKASPRTVSQAILQDFQIVDKSLMESALMSMEAAGQA